MMNKFLYDLGEAMIWDKMDDAVRNRDFDRCVELITKISTHRHLDFDEGLRTIE